MCDENKEGNSYSYSDDVVPLYGEMSAWDTSALQGLCGAFSPNRFSRCGISTGCTGLTGPGKDITGLNISSVTTLAACFDGASTFNQDISSWDVSSVVDMSDLFRGATAFNQNLSSWQTSSVTTMARAFLSAQSFNGDISSWDTSKVLYMGGIFFDAQSFNVAISSWNVGQVVNMWRAFDKATAFNKDLSTWNVSSVVDMESMFNGATAFNQDLCDWGDRMTTPEGNLRPSVTTIFQGSSCPELNDPSVSGSSPFLVSPLCSICTSSTSTRRNLRGPGRGSKDSVLEINLSSPSTMLGDHNVTTNDSVQLQPRRGLVGLLDPTGHVGAVPRLNLFDDPVQGGVVKVFATQMNIPTGRLGLEHAAVRT